MATLRRILFATLSIVLMLLAAMFAYSNPTPIDVDVGFVKLERVSLALAFAFVFVGRLAVRPAHGRAHALAQREREAAT